MKKRIAPYVLAACAFLGTMQIMERPRAQDAERPAQNQKALPHYLRNVSQPANEIDQIIEQARVIDAFGHSFGTTTYTNSSIEVQRQVHGKLVTIYFHNYTQQDGNIRYAHANGFDTMSRADFALVQSDVITSLERAATEAYNDHSRLSSRIIEIQEAHLKRNNRLPASQKLEDLLDRTVPGRDGITYADVLGIPRLAITDFVPSQFHFGPLPRGILGVTYLNSELVVLHPLAQQLDYVAGTPNILKHELIHNCQKLQGIPFVYEFDAEFHASMIEQDNALWFLRHPYLEDSRSLARVLFSFDAERALNEAKPVTLMGGSQLRRDVLERYVAGINRIRDTIRTTYINDFMPEFYTHFTFWSAVNEDLNDSNGAFKIFMWSKFQPTLLQGAQNTYRWLSQNRQVIEEASRQALNNVRNNQDPNSRGIAHFIENMPQSEQQSIRNMLSAMGVRSDEDLRPLLRVLNRLGENGTLDRLRRLR